MSSLYNLEPTPTAKVLLQTTAGDIVLELFAKETPLASRNFLQHCLNGYYDGTIFHRVVPGFIVQGGDPNGTGHGGQSIYSNGVFADEFSTRLKYTRRGLLGMANSGNKNDNGSQFFITLGPTPELTNKNTLFGRVAGDTIFNVIKIGEAELAAEGSDRPLYPEKVISTEILVNIFEDMVKQELIAKPKPEANDRPQKKKQKRKIGKSMLSFGDDGDGNDNDSFSLSLKKPKFNSKVVSDDPQIIPSQENRSGKTTPSATEGEAAESRPLPKEVKAKDDPNVTQSALTPAAGISKKDKFDQAQAEIDALKASLKRTVPEKVVQEEPKPVSAIEAMTPATSIRAQKRGAGPNAEEDARALALLNAFQSKLDSVMHTESAADTAKSKTENGVANFHDDYGEAELCDLHFIANCQSCSDWTSQEQDDQDAGQGWMSHQLTFAKDRLGKDLEWKRRNEEELVVVDPRERAKEIRLEKNSSSKRDGKHKQSQREGHRSRDSKLK